MQREIVFERLEPFLEEMDRIGISKLVFAEISEKRAQQVESNKLEVVHYRKLEILAYKSPTIYKCLPEEYDAAALRESLEARGYEVKLRSRNIT